MLVGIPIVLLLAAGGGMYLAAVGLRPITEALRIQRQFTADASHELRTPVSVVRAAAEVTLSRDHRDEAEYRESALHRRRSGAAAEPSRRRHAGARPR